MRMSKRIRIAVVSMALLLLLPLANACADPSTNQSETTDSAAPAASASVNGESDTEPEAAQSTELGTGTQNPEMSNDSRAAAYLGYTVELVKSEYSVSDSGFAVRFKATGSESYIVRGEKWALYKEENGQRVLVGQNGIETSIEHDVPKEFTLSLRSLGMSELTEGVFYLQHLVTYKDETGMHQNVPLCDLRLIVK